MEGGAVLEEKQAPSSSYRYWVREATADAAPLPVPKKLSPRDVSDLSASQPSTTIGSLWNSAGTWEEKNLNRWSGDRLKELLNCIDPLEFSNGKAAITEVSRCTGDAFLVTVRNKKRVGYTYELKLEVKGEWLVGDEERKVEGHLDIPEFSYGELDDLLVTVKLKDDKDLREKDKHCICQDLKLFLQPLREKLLQFEKELRER